MTDFPDCSGQLVVLEDEGQFDLLLDSKRSLLREGVYNMFPVTLILRDVILDIMTG